MHILHYSDRYDNKLQEQFELCDMLFTTGDLSYMDFSPIKSIISSKPAFGVYGNHCFRGYLEKLGIHNVHLQPIEYQGFYETCYKSIKVWDIILLRSWICFWRGRIVD